MADMTEFVVRATGTMGTLQLVHTECGQRVRTVATGDTIDALTDTASDHECEATRQARARRMDRRFRTANNVLITDGLRVWDYDRKPGTVDLVRSRVDDQYWDGWFAVRSDRGGYSTMNGERLTTVDPFTGESPPPAPIESGDDK